MMPWVKDLFSMQALEVVLKCLWYGKCITLYYSITHFVLKKALFCYCVSHGLQAKVARVSSPRHQLKAVFSGMAFPAENSMAALC